MSSRPVLYGFGAAVTLPPGFPVGLPGYITREGSACCSANYVRLCGSVLRLDTPHNSPPQPYAGTAPTCRVDAQSLNARRHISGCALSGENLRHGVPCNTPRVYRPISARAVTCAPLPIRPAYAGHSRMVPTATIAGNHASVRKLASPRRPIVGPYVPIIRGGLVIRVRFVTRHAPVIAARRVVFAYPLPAYIQSRRYLRATLPALPGVSGRVVLPALTRHRRCSVGYRSPDIRGRWGAIDPQRDFVGSRTRNVARSVRRCVLTLTGCPVRRLDLPRGSRFGHKVA